MNQLDTAYFLGFADLRTEFMWVSTAAECCFHFNVELLYAKFPGSAILVYSVSQMPKAHLPSRILLRVDVETAAHVDGLMFRATLSMRVIRMCRAIEH